MLNFYWYNNFRGFLSVSLDKYVYNRPFHFLFGYLFKQENHRNNYFNNMI